MSGSLSPKLPAVLHNPSFTEEGRVRSVTEDSFSRLPPAEGCRTSSDSLPGAEPAPIGTFSPGEDWLLVDCNLTQRQAAQALFLGPREGRRTSYRIIFYAFCLCMVSALKPAFLSIVFVVKGHDGNDGGWYWMGIWCSNICMGLGLFTVWLRGGILSNPNAFLFYAMQATSLELEMAARYGLYLPKYPCVIVSSLFLVLVLTAQVWFVKARTRCGVAFCLSIPQACLASFHVWLRVSGSSFDRQKNLQPWSTNGPGFAFG